MKSATTPTPINEYSPAAVSTLADARTQRHDGKLKLIKVTFEVPDEHGPTLRSVVEELTNRVGGMIAENIYEFPIEHTLTKTACVIGALRGAVFPKVETEDPDYVSLL